MQEIILAFSSAAHAIAAEQLLLAKGLPVRVMPLPSNIKAGCGICLRLPPAQLEAAQNLLNLNTDIRYTLYSRSQQNGKIHYTPL